MKIGGTLIRYYLFCPRELWFFVYKITTEDYVENTKIGKYVEEFYKREKKFEEITLIDETISPDVIKKEKDYVLILEIKKSNKTREAAIWQLKYYLWYLEKNKGLKVKGKLIIPEENKEEEVELTEEDKEKLREIIRNIEKIIKLDKPPKVPKKPKCKYCSYRVLCWSDEI